jgi:hypothetical protein
MCSVLEPGRTEWDGSIPRARNGSDPVFGSEKFEEWDGSIFCSVGSRIEEWNGTVLAQLTSLLYMGEHTSQPPVVLARLAFKPSPPPPSPPSLATVAAPAEPTAAPAEPHSSRRPRRAEGELRRRGRRRGRGRWEGEPRRRGRRRGRGRWEGEPLPVAGMETHG